MCSTSSSHPGQCGLLCAVVYALLAGGSPLILNARARQDGGADKDLRIKVEGKGVLHKKVIVFSADASLQAEPGDGGKAVGPFSVFHWLKTDAGEEEHNGFVRVGTSSGKPLGWLQRKHVVVWNTRMLVMPIPLKAGQPGLVIYGKFDQANGKLDSEIARPVNQRPGHREVLPIVEKAGLDSAGESVFKVVVPDAQRGGDNVITGFVCPKNGDRATGEVRCMLFKREVLRLASTLDFAYSQLSEMIDPTERASVGRVMETIQLAMAASVSGEEVRADSKLKELVKELPLKMQLLETSPQELIAMDTGTFRAWLDKIKRSRDRMKRLAEESREWMVVSGGTSADLAMFVRLSEFP